MLRLWARYGQAVGELGQKLLLESNTLTPLLKRVEILGNIKRQRDPVDERQVRVHLTDAGRKLRQRALHIPRCILDATGLNARQAAFERVSTDVCLRFRETGFYGAETTASKTARDIQLIVGRDKVPPRNPANSRAICRRLGNLCLNGTAWWSWPRCRKDLSRVPCDRACG